MFKAIINLFFHQCEKTGRITGIKLKSWYSFLFLPVLGILATAWIVIRLLPKPSRLSYPCMKVAVPLSSSFFVFLAGLMTSVFSLKKLGDQFRRRTFNLPLIALLIVAASMGLLLAIGGSSDPGYAAYDTIQQPANQPLGEAKGIFPGRVVWVYNPEATNENCTNTHDGSGEPSSGDDGWFLNKNNDQTVIDQMLSDVLQGFTELETDSAAWDTLFKYHNVQRGKGAVGYEPGETFFIKVNSTSGWGFGQFWGNITENYTVAENDWYGISETSPHLVLSVLRQLVNVVGVPQSDIYIGDPIRNIYKHRFDLWNSEFPDVHYMNYDPCSGEREQVQRCDSAIIDYSDRGSVITAEKDTLYQVFMDCEYLLNIPTMKGHKHAGMTMFAKNHFGSQSRSSAEHLHPGLIDPVKGEEEDNRFEYGVYRVQVDLLGHELLGKKNLFYLMDALWSAGMEISQPSKWKMAPFNGDWSSSLFFSQDPVAIESVGYDFLRSEYTIFTHPYETHVQMPATDDYLQQAADSTYWPEGIVYDPENDGVPISSLGVHEHWNNADDMQYSRNLGTGDGIELVKMLQVPSAVESDVQLAETFKLNSFPNPFNPAVTLEYSLSKSADVKIAVYDITGRQVAVMDEGYQQAGLNTRHIDFAELNVSSGQYFIQVYAGEQQESAKVTFIK